MKNEGAGPKEGPSAETLAKAALEASPNGPPHPFQVNLDQFIERIDSLADHMRLAMVAISQSSKQEATRFQEFVRTQAKPVEGEKNAFTIPEDRFTEFRRLQRKLHRSRFALTSVPRSFTVALVSEFDAFMSATLRAFYHLKPEALNASDRKLTYAELAAFGSIEAAREHIIEKDVETYLRSSHSEQFVTLESKLGIPLRKDLPVWKDFIELTERRNLFVHNDGVVNSHYLQVCSSERYDCSKLKKGLRLGVSKNYFARAHEAVFELAAKLSHVLWRKLSPETGERADGHFAGTLIYDLVYEKRYRLAQTLADFGSLTFKNKWTSDYYRRALVVNRAQAYIWDGKRDEGLRILAAEDWSAASDEFQVCVAALRQDYAAALRYMKSIGPASKPSKDGYRDYPVFRELRKTPEFQQTFLEIFGEPLATVTLPDTSDVPTETPEESPTGPLSAVSETAEPTPPKVH
jgi:hypothetical protein